MHSHEKNKENTIQIKASKTQYWKDLLKSLRLERR